MDLCSSFRYWLAGTSSIIFFAVYLFDNDWQKSCTDNDFTITATARFLRFSLDEQYNLFFQ